MARRKFFCFLMVVFITAIFCYHASMAKAQTSSLTLTSPAFAHNQAIPRKYTCQGDDVNPALNISGLPAGTQSLALIVDDPDAPGGNWDHWLVYNIPPSEAIAKNGVPGVQLRNDFRRREYGGPCPPSGTHRYFFKLFALDTQLTLVASATKNDLLKSMDGHILAQTELIGLYKKTF